MTDTTTVLRGATRWTAALIVAVGGIAWALFGREMALGVALGALLGLLNLLALGRALGLMLSSAQQHRPAAGKKWVLPTVLLLKWPFLLLALGLILWYMPARPEGVAVGFGLSLLAASLAAIRGSKKPPATTPGNTP